MDADATHSSGAGRRSLWEGRKFFLTAAGGAQVENDLPHEQVEVACGFLTTKPDFIRVSS